MKRKLAIILAVALGIPAMLMLAMIAGSAGGQG